MNIWRCEPMDRLQSKYHPSSCEGGERTSHADVKRQRRNNKRAPGVTSRTKRSDIRISVLKSCTTSRDLDKVRRIHADSTMDTSSLYLACTLLSSYSRCGSLLDAHRLFDELPHRNVVAWTSLILGYAQQEDDHGASVALHLFSTMQLHGCSPNARTFLAAVKACIALAEHEPRVAVDGGFIKPRSLATGIAVHIQALGQGYGRDIYLRTSLVEMYSCCGSMSQARSVFEGAEMADVVLWTALIMGYVEHGDEILALEMFERMKRVGCEPNHRTFVVALKACSRLAVKEEGSVQVGNGRVVKAESLRRGICIHSQAAVSGCDANMFLASSLVDMYAKCGDMVDARRVFDRMAEHDTVSWNALIVGYVGNGEEIPALRALTRMCTVGRAVPDVCTYLAGLLAAGRLVALEFGKGIHAEVCRRCLEGEKALATSLVDFYGKCGSMTEAQVVFDAMRRRDSVAWTALLGGYSRRGHSGNVFRLFRMMVAEGLHGDETTFVCVLALCSHAGLVVKGREWFEEMKETYGVARCEEHYNCLVDMFGRSQP